MDKKFEEFEKAVLKFAKVKSKKPQNHHWVRSKIKSKHDQCILKHVISHHYDALTKSIISCQALCGFSAQELCDTLDFSSPGRSKFDYTTSYQSYPRLMKIMPGIDHIKYNTMAVGYMEPLKIMTHFAVTNSPWDPSYDEIIMKRFKGTFFDDHSIQAFMATPKSSRSGMLNRWKKNPAIDHMLEILHVAEVMAA